MKILLLEDDKQLNRAITDYLTLKGLSVTSFYDGDKVVDAVGGYDLYLLDINTPNINGIDILKYIHENTESAKVIMISANIDIQMIKVAYENGCYDYLKKPFQIEELFFKIDNIAKNIDKNTIFSKNVLFNNITKELLVAKREVSLTKKEVTLLELLIKSKNKVVTYEEIEFEVYDGESVASTTIRTLVKRLREKLGKEFIQTVVNIGYKICITEA